MDQTLMPRAKLDLTGKIIGRLRIIELSHIDRHGSTVWKCLCNCGVTVFKRGASLNTPSHTRSCGCLRKEVTSARKTIHGLSKSVEWQSYRNARSRCMNKRNK